MICLCSWFWILFSSSNTVALGCRCRSSRFSKGGSEITWLKSYRNIPQEKCLLCTIALIWVYTGYLHLHILFRANPYFVTRLILFILFLPLGLLLISFFSMTWWSVAWSWVRLYSLWGLWGSWQHSQSSPLLGDRQLHCPLHDSFCQHCSYGHIMWIIYWEPLCVMMSFRSDELILDRR